ncbi:hypothetical protein [Cyanobium gracile]|uniref:Uncharacterized protein n=1 Tax=Cyanobium gracile UHCC 0281 TaxID=3110309 RepID=A0ABU5SY81_9CYAN|nr:hypothetical protein [Cyanobium gracile]MEA5443481.1 hypothetical protein [Cyanobium gracile UHCC 0281]
MPRPLPGPGPAEGVDGTGVYGWGVGGPGRGSVNRVATLEHLPYVVTEWPSVRQMLEGNREGRLEMAVGCINVSPDRL